MMIFGAIIALIFVQVKTFQKPPTLISDLQIKFRHDPPAFETGGGDGSLIAGNAETKQPIT